VRQGIFARRNLIQQVGGGFSVQLLVDCRISPSLPGSVAIAGSATWVAQMGKRVEPVCCEVADLVVPEVALVKSIPPRVASAGRPGRVSFQETASSGTPRGRIVRRGTDLCCSGTKAREQAVRWSSTGPGPLRSPWVPRSQSRGTAVSGLRILGGTGNSQPFTGRNAGFDDEVRVDLVLGPGLSARPALWEGGTGGLRSQREFVRDGDVEDGGSRSPLGRRRNGTGRDPPSRA
jgi:hypothetical protein